MPGRCGCTAAAVLLWVGRKPSALKLAVLWLHLVVLVYPV